MKRNRREQPDWLEEENAQLSTRFAETHNLEDEISDEEYDRWMWEHASERMKAYWKSNEGTDDEGRPN